MSRQKYIEGYGGYVIDVFSKEVVDIFPPFEDDDEAIEDTLDTIDTKQGFDPNEWDFEDEDVCIKTDDDDDDDNEKAIVPRFTCKRISEKEEPELHKKLRVKCECGAEKTKCGHSTWCPKYKE